MKVTLDTPEIEEILKEHLRKKGFVIPEDSFAEWVEDPQAKTFEVEFGLPSGVVGK